MCYDGDVEVRKLEHQVQHLTESQRRSDDRQARLKDDNGQLVERSPSYHSFSLIAWMIIFIRVCIVTWLPATQASK